MSRTARMAGALIACVGLLLGCSGGRPAASPTTSSSTSSSATATTLGLVTTSTTPISTSASTTSAPTSVGSTTPGSPRRRGTLLQVVAPSVMLNGAAVSSRTTLHDHDRLETQASGEADFSLDTKVKTCTALKGTRIEVAPDPATLLRWDEGSAICVTSAGGVTAMFGAGTDAVLTVVDPVFEVTVADGTTTVKVDKGFVSLKAKGSSGTMIVGFNEQATVTSEGPQGLGPFDPGSDPDAKVFGRLVRANPVTTYSRPRPGTSPTLQRVFGRGQLRVTTTASPDSSESAFVQAAMARLSAAWGLQPPSYVAAGQSDVTVTTGTGGVPLFESGLDPWAITTAADAVLTSAVRTFVSNYLNTGEYASDYGTSFNGQIAPYDILRPILFAG